VSVGTVKTEEKKSRWVRHELYVREGKNMYSILMEKREGVRLRGRPRIMLDNNIEVDLIKEDGRA
jgi:hypothetical protein